MKLLGVREEVKMGYKTMDGLSKVMDGDSMEFIASLSNVIMTSIKQIE